MQKTGGLIAEKRALREKLKAARQQIAAPDRAAFSTRIVREVTQLPEVSRAEVCFVYLSYGTEVHTHALIDHFIEQGKTILVPSIRNKETMEAALFPGWDALTPGALGIPSPKPGAARELAVDLVITPGLGFTPKGDRIGFGAGYYDKWFSQHPVKCKAALAFEAQIVESMPTAATDIRVDIIVTERRVIRIRTSR